MTSDHARNGEKKKPFFLISYRKTKNKVRCARLPDEATAAVIFIYAPLSGEASSCWKHKKTQKPWKTQKWNLLLLPLCFGNNRWAESLKFKLKCQANILQTFQSFLSNKKKIDFLLVWVFFYYYFPFHIFNAIFPVSSRMSSRRLTGLRMSFNYMSCIYYLLTHWLCLRLLFAVLCLIPCFFYRRWTVWIQSE